MEVYGSCKGYQKLISTMNRLRLNNMLWIHLLQDIFLQEFLIPSFNPYNFQYLPQTGLAASIILQLTIQFPHWHQGHEEIQTHIQWKWMKSWSHAHATPTGLVSRHLTPASSNTNLTCATHKSAVTPMLLQHCITWRIFCCLCRHLNEGVALP